MQTKRQNETNKKELSTRCSRLQKRSQIEQPARTKKFRPKANKPSGNVSDTVKALIKSDLKDVRVVNVSVKRGRDFDGGRVLKINVVYDGVTTPVLDAQKIVGTARHLRPELTKIGEDAFPLISFVSSKDPGLKSLESE